MLFHVLFAYFLKLKAPWLYSQQPLPDNTQQCGLAPLTLVLALWSILSYNKVKITCEILTSRHFPVLSPSWCKSDRLQRGSRTPAARLWRSVFQSLLPTTCLGSRVSHPRIPEAVLVRNSGVSQKLSQNSVRNSVRDSLRNLVRTVRICHYYRAGITWLSGLIGLHSVFFIRNPL